MSKRGRTARKPKPVASYYTGQAGSWWYRQNKKCYGSINNMAINPKVPLARLTRTKSAWTALRPNKSFAGMTLDQFNTKTGPSLAARDLIDRLENELIAAQNQRDEADQVTIDTLKLVVNAVKGDVDEGEDGELYEAMGYVRTSERKSGLGRKSKAAATKQTA